MRHEQIATKARRLILRRTRQGAQRHTDCSLADAVADMLVIEAGRREIAATRLW